MPIKNFLRGRSIRAESDALFLFESDTNSLAGFLVLEPRHMKCSLRTWAFLVLEHLEAFTFSAQANPQINALWGSEETENDFVVAPHHSFPFFYKEGDIRITPNLGMVEISSSHPCLLEVAEELVHVGRRGLVVVV